MENPIKIDDLGVPLFLETPNLKVTANDCFHLNVATRGISLSSAAAEKHYKVGHFWVMSFESSETTSFPIGSMWILWVLVCVCACIM